MSASPAALPHAVRCMHLGVNPVDDRLSGPLLLVQELGYKPQMRLDEGIKRFCEWFKRYYDLRDDSNGSNQAADWGYDPL